MSNRLDKAREISGADAFRTEIDKVAEKIKSTQSEIAEVGETPSLTKKLGQLLSYVNKLIASRTDKESNSINEVFPEDKD